MHGPKRVFCKEGAPFDKYSKHFKAHKISDERSRGFTFAKASINFAKLILEEGLSGIGAVGNTDQNFASGEAS
jgi:hypothetical protein